MSPSSSSNDGCKTKVVASRSTKPFLIRLYDLIDGGEYQDCLDWYYSSDDQTYYICIKSVQGLLEKALVSIGVHISSIKSFDSSMNSYGFSNRNHKKGLSLCWHRLFQKGNREQLLHMKRRSSKSLAAVSPFLVRLYDLIDDGEYNDCIDWYYTNEDRNYHIRIKSVQGLLEKALVSIGAQYSSIKSFYSNLRSYGFTTRHQKNGISLCSYSKFQKGNREDVLFIKRRPSRYLQKKRKTKLIATPFGVGCGNCENPTPLRHQQACQNHLRRCWSKDDTRKPEELFQIAEEKAISLRDVNVAEYLLPETTIIIQCSNCHKQWEKSSTALSHCQFSSSGCVRSCLKNVSCRKTTCGRWVPKASISEAMKVRSSAQVANRSKYVRPMFSYGWPISNGVEVPTLVEPSAPPRQSDDSFENVSVPTMMAGIFDKKEDGRGNDGELPIPVEATPARQPDDSFENVSGFDDAEDDASNDIEMQITDEPTAEDSHARSGNDVEVLPPAETAPARQPDNVVENASVSTMMGGTFDDADEDGCNDVEVPILVGPTAARQPEELVEKSAARLTSDDSLSSDDSSIAESTSNASDSLVANDDEGADVKVIEPFSQQRDLMGGIFDDAEDDPLPPEVFPYSQYPHTPSIPPPFLQHRLLMCDELLRIGMEIPMDIPLRTGPKPAKRRKRNAREGDEAEAALMRRPTKKAKATAKVKKASPATSPKPIARSRSGRTVKSRMSSDYVEVGYLPKKSQSSNDSSETAAKSDLGPSSSDVQDFDMKLFKRWIQEENLDSTPLPQLDDDDKSVVVPKGVTIRPYGKWQVQIWFQGSNLHIGLFENQAEARRANAVAHQLLKRAKTLRPKLNSNACKELVAAIRDYVMSLCSNTREAAAAAKPDLPDDFDMRMFQQWIQEENLDSTPLPQLGDAKSVVSKGVSMRPSGKWQARIWFQGSDRYIGVFESQAEACRASTMAHQLLKRSKTLRPKLKLCHVVVDGNWGTFHLSKVFTLS